MFGTKPSKTILVQNICTEICKKKYNQVSLVLVFELTLNYVKQAWCN